MKDLHYYRRFITSLVFVLQGFLCTGQDITPLQGRNIISALYQEEIAAASSTEIQAKNIGDWYEVIETVSFMLIRYTEVFRGKMRLIITDSQKAICRIYPDGTTVISTAVLDYIDTVLFSDTQTNLRRVKNFNFEREQLLAPMLAFEAARFALNQEVNAFVKTGKESFSKPSDNDIFTADEFSIILLKLAGYNTQLAENFLTSLKEIKEESAYDGSFSAFFDSLPDIEKRIERITQAQSNAIKLSEEIANTILTLKRQTSESEACQNIAAFKEIFKDSLYFSRLEALVFHKMLLEQLPKELYPILTAFPASVQTQTFLEERFPYLKRSADKPKSAEINEQISEAVGNQFFVEAVNAYKCYNNVIYEPLAVSAYAMLLIFSNNPEDKAEAVRIAEQASLQENNSASVVALINYASVLFLSGTDPAKAKSIFEKLLSKQPSSSNITPLLNEGQCSDERFIIYNYILLLYKLGEKNTAEKMLSVLQKKVYCTKNGSGVTVRKIQAGSSMDELIKHWGKPALIAYNYLSEKWYYDYLKAGIIISSNADSAFIEQIDILNSSPLTLPGGIRTGESKKVFEKTFGKPVYYANDSSVYFYNGNIIHILYLSGAVRVISLTLPSK